MHHICKLLAVVLSVLFCLGFASCTLFQPPQSGEENTSPFSTEPETTPEETTPEETTTEETTTEETTPEETTPEVTEPDFSNTPDPDGTKRY